jgi:serine/threonine protein kinase
MSPQIVEEKRYTYKTDIWSLGVIYYELLTGKYPFQAEKMDQLEKCLNNGFYVLQMPHLPSIEDLHIITMCLNQKESERASIEELSLLPYLFEDGYQPHYLDEGAKENDEHFQIRRRSNSPDDRSHLISKKRFKMVLSSKDSHF